jgi:energy-coupling factor transporter ATP-binding protein EcfA2
MQLRQVKIENFRGIRHFDWKPDAAVSCLIGPGDSTKTTILDAIDCAVTSRWNVAIAETDFHTGRFKEPITITVTVGQLPPALLQEDSFGLDLRGWNASEGLKDEPEGADEPVLTIRFHVDGSLEPIWRIVNDRRPDGRRISAKDREAFGLVRLGGDIDRHLSWTRGSLLTRQTDSLLEVGRVLADAHRQARELVSNANLTKLATVAERLEERAKQLGVNAPGTFRPGLETMLTVGGMGPLSLHAADIPVRALGLGSRRLVALALQWMAVTEGAIVLVDEVEHALEPHRLRHLLRVLRAAPREGKGQVILTTHSSVAVEEMAADELLSVRCEDGRTSARRVSSDLQALVRGNSEAFLGRNVLVCEGKTEIGLCRGLIPSWAESRQKVPLAQTGTAFALGNGEEAAGRAQKLALLGYRTALFADSDKAIDPDVPSLEQSGVRVIRWAGTVATEKRIALDLPWTALQPFFDLMVEAKGEESVLSAVRKALPGGTAVPGTSIEAWRSDIIDESAIRGALGSAAKATRAFKQVDPGEQLGTLVGASLPAIPASDLSVKLSQVAAWCYGE